MVVTIKKTINNKDFIKNSVKIVEAEVCLPLPNE